MKNILYFPSNYTASNKTDRSNKNKTQQGVNTFLTNSVMKTSIHIITKWERLKFSFRAKIRHKFCCTWLWTPYCKLVDISNATVFDSMTPRLVAKAKRSDQRI